MNLKSIISYLSDVKLEFAKVVWLKPKELSQLVLMVLITTILSACFFAVIDIVSQSLIMRSVFM